MTLLSTTIMMSRREPVIAAILMMTMTPSVTLYAHSEQSHRSPMARMEAVFAAARPAKRSELNGNWVLVSLVTTQQFITGQKGPTTS